MVERRVVATLILTDGVVLGAVGLLVAVVGSASEHLRAYLLDAVDAVSLAAALLLLVSAWILGLATLGAGLAWRATAWTLETGFPPAVADSTRSSPTEEASTV
jgi:hypothetical protein